MTLRRALILFLRLGLGLLSLGLAILLVAPWNPLFAIDSQLDTSWRLYYCYAFTHHVQFGPDLIFNYGPWGFALNDVYTPATFNWMLLARSVIAAGIFAGLWRLVKNLRMPVLFVPIWIVAVVFWAGLISAHDGLFLAMALLPVLVALTEKWRGLCWEGPVLAIGLAMVALCKFSFLMLASGTIGLVTIYELVRLRKMPWIAICFAAALVVGWWGAGQSLAHLPKYIATSWTMASSFSGAMGLIDPDFFMIPTFYLVSGCWAVLLAATVWRRDRWAAAGVFVATAVTLFFCFKEGFTRHDGHEFMATTGLATVAWMIGPVVLGISRRMWAVGAVILLLGVSLWCLNETDTRFFNRNLKLDIEAQLGISEMQWSHFRQWEQGGWRVADFDRQYERGQQAIRTANPLPAVKGNVDVFGYLQGAAMAWGMDLKMLPVFQPYQATDGRLQRANERALAAPEAAENVFFQNLTIDYRYPSLDGGMSWPELVSRYDIVDLTGQQILVLRKSARPRGWSLQSLGSVDCGLGQMVRVPDGGGGGVWASIEMKPTLAGAMETSLLHATEVWMNVVTDDGVTQQYRIVPAMAASGFLLSPVVENTTDFAEFATIDQKRTRGLRRVKEISIVLPHTSAPSLWFNRRIKVHFSRFNFERQGAGRIPGMQVAGNLAEMARTNVTPLSNAVFQGGDGSLGVYSHPVSAEKLTVPAGAIGLKFQYGLLPAIWDKSQGVIFRISALDTDGSTHLLWTRTVTPMIHTEDRAQLSGSLSIADDRPRTLVFETLPVASLSYCWAYWADVRFEFPPSP